MSLAKTEARRLWMESCFEYFDELFNDKYFNELFDIENGQDFNNLRLIGFDLSLRKTGYFVLNEAGEEVDRGMVKTSADNEEPENMAVYSNQIQELFDTHSPDLVAWESVTAGGPSTYYQSTKQLSMALSLLMHQVAQLRESKDVGVLFPASKSMQKFVTGKGQGRKDITMKEIYKSWGIDVEVDDIADAFGVARMSLDAVKLAKRFVSLRQAYQSSQQEFDDLQFLIDFEKYRMQQKACEESMHNPIQQYQHDAICSMLQPSSSGDPFEAKNFRVLKYNDYGRHQATKQSINERHETSS